MIYTTYFAKLNKLPKNIVPISICEKAPVFYENLHGIQYKKLALKYEFFMEWKQNHNNDYYVSCFYDQVLKHLNVEKVVRELYNLSYGKDVALVCYEKPTDFCHRHLVAQWLSNNGYSCYELNI